MKEIVDFGTGITGSVIKWENGEKPTKKETVYQVRRASLSQVTLLLMHVPISLLQVTVPMILVVAAWWIHMH